MAAILKAISDLNVSPFESAMGRMEKRVDKFASGNLAQLGRTIGAVFSVYAVARFASSVGAAADQLDNISKASGVGVENLQAINVLFTEGGRSAEDAAAVFSRLKKAMDEATVDEKIAQSFMRLGISFDDISRKSPDRILELIAVAMRENAGDMQMGEAAGNLLGRTYADLQGVMNTLATQGLDPLRESLLATNQIMGEDAVAAADKMQEAYDRLGRKLKTGAGNALITFFGGLKAAGIRLTGGTADEAAEALFGPTDTANDPLANKAANDAKAASASKMRETAFKRVNAAMLAADAFRSSAESKVAVSGVRASDRLASIGGYIGGQSNPAAQMAERQLKVLEIQKQYQERIAKATESTEGLTREVKDNLEE